MTDWKEEYKRKLVLPEEALKVIKSGDRVAFTFGLEPVTLTSALVS